MTQHPLSLATGDIDRQALKASVANLERAERIGDSLKAREDAVAAMLAQLGIEHEWQGTSVRLRLPSGEFGPFVDLRGGEGRPGRPGDPGLPGLPGPPGNDGADAYVYIAYASDSSGANFTTTFNASLDYIAIKTTIAPIAEPDANDFAGLWKNYRGLQGAPGNDGSNGAIWYAGSDDPAGGSGANGDFYLQVGSGSTGVLGDVWTKIGGAWYQVANIRGAAGEGSGDMEAATYDPGGIAANVFARSNHTGTQPASTISDFDAAADARINSRIAALDVMVFKGTINCSSNPNYPAADAGHQYRVSVAGKIGGGSGPNVEIGDILICEVDSTTAGNHATVGANWNIIQANIDGAVVGPASATDSHFAQFDGPSGRLIKGGKAAPAGAVVGTSDTQTLSNKTLASPIINTPSGLTKADVGLGNVTNDAQIAATLLTTRGDLIRRGASAPERVGLGAAGTLLGSDGTDAIWRTLTAVLDAVMGSTRGQILYRGASTWGVLSKGSQYQPLQAGANDPEYGPLNLAQSAAVTGILPAANHPDGTTGAKGILQLATASEFRAANSAKALVASEVWTAAGFVTLADAATIAVDMSTFLSLIQTTITANRAAGAPTNTKAGQYFIWKVTASGATRTLSLNAVYKLATGVESFPISITTSETVFICGFVEDSSNIRIYAVLRF